MKYLTFLILTATAAVTGCGGGSDAADTAGEELIAAYDLCTSSMLTTRTVDPVICGTDLEAAMSAYQNARSSSNISFQAGDDSTHSRVTAAQYRCVQARLTLAAEELRQAYPTLP